VSKVSSRKLPSRSHSVDRRADNVRGNLEENSSTDFSQEGGFMTGVTRESDIITSNANLRNTNNDSAINNLNSDQPKNISRDQLQDFLSTVMQVIKAESAKQTAALHEESKKYRSFEGGVC
jgi:hypothetical protein